MSSTPITDPSTSPAASVASVTTKPTILALELDDGGTFDYGIYGGLVSALNAGAQLEKVPDTNNPTVTSTDAALTYLTSPTTKNPSVILAIDAGATDPNHAAILPHLTGYVRAGGTLIFCCSFSGYAPMGSLGTFFQSAFSLPWTMASYHRTTFALNGSALRRVTRVDALSPRYSTKGVHLGGVEQKDRVYVPCAGARVQSWVFAPERVDRDETAVAWAEVGEGMVGYVADVNAEPESTEIVLSMCGL